MTKETNGKKVFLAVDLGAGSGRVMAAAFDGVKISLEEVSRWASAPIKIGNSLPRPAIEHFVRKRFIIRFGYIPVAVGQASEIQVVIDDKSAAIFHCTKLFESHSQHSSYFFHKII